MKIRHVIENDIVEDISIYKSIYNEYINFIKEELNQNYEPSFSFDEFCVLMIENFDGVDEEVIEHRLNYDVYCENEKTLTQKLMDSILMIAKNELKDNPMAIEIIENYIKNEK